ncbi:MAG TPA: helix-turn-helix domain-containing protein [Stellaceae bacterium]|nr:helix-turn-helix domain-containing protein [Stellaceae bacterium]
MSSSPEQNSPELESPAPAPAALEAEPVLTRPKHTIGALLRETRENFGGDVERIANALRIRAQYLVAIEEGRYDRLPAPVYALGFVRAYAIHLGLDGDEAVRRFKQEASGFEISRDLVFPVPLGERGIPHTRILAAAVLLLLAAYGAWYYLSSGGRARPERVSAVPSALLPPSAAPSTANPPPPPSVSQPAPPPAAPAATTESAPTLTPPSSPPPPAGSAAPALMPPPPPTSGSPSNTENVAPVLKPPVLSRPQTSITPPAQTAALPPSDSGASVMPGPGNLHVFGATDAAARIVIHAKDGCWIKVRDQNGTTVFERLMKPGDVYRVPEQAGLALYAGNASALAVAVDGQDVPPLTGKVRHDIRLDPDQLKAGTAVVD